MNVYDFDKTIYNGDSTIDFFFFSLKEDVKLVRFIPKQIWGFILYKFGFISKTEFKSMFFSFIKAIKNNEEHLQKFWILNKKKIKRWYLQKKKTDDVIISASPEFLLEPVCKDLNIEHLIASKICIKTGKFERDNCYGEEKVKRFFEVFPDGEIDNFFSDSFSDLPMAKKAKAAFLVRKNKFNDFTYSNISIISKVKEKFFSIQFLKFLLVGILNVINGVLLSGFFSLFISQANIAFVLGYIMSLCISFLLNTFFVFSDKILSFNKFIKFCISYVPNFILQNVIVYILSFFLPNSNFLIYAISATISFPLTYLLLCCFAFKKE